LRPRLDIVEAFMAADSQRWGDPVFAQKLTFG